MNSKYSLINKDNIVINIIMWDGETKWTLPDGHYLVKSDVGHIGWIYDPETKEFKEPVKREEL